MTVPRMMLVHAHPDDESLWTGGTIARHVELGGDVSVVTATWATGTSRHGELRNALTELGVTREPIMLGFADDGVPVSAPGAKRFCDVSFDKQVRILVGHIRRLRPEILLTYDPVGIYGHRDHVHTRTGWPSRPPMPQAPPCSIGAPDRPGASARCTWPPSPTG